ncbi:MAG: DUF4126 domain-containing protein [Oscillochloris sp.]|nr:DUF4126 domain-containing protein [Oscillochloris sp.]
MGTLIALATGLGLSTAAGLNAFLPLLTIGILARFGLVELAAPFQLLSHPLVLLIAAVLVILDFVGDKLPAVDSALHAIGIIIAPIAGAILALAAQSDVAVIHPAVVAIAGVAVAATTHIARTAVRPMVTTATAGTANPLISLAEDATALVLSVLAIFAPLVAIILAIVLIVIFFRVFRQALRIWSERDADGE